MKKQQEKLPANIYIKFITPGCYNILIIERSVDFDGKPLKDGISWNPAFISISITQQDADKLHCDYGVPIKVE